MIEPNADAPRLIKHPDLPQFHPQMWTAVEQALTAGAFGANVAEVFPGEFGDKTPKFLVNVDLNHHFPKAVIPGFVSGPMTMQELMQIAMTGHALKLIDPGDDRTPACDYLHIVGTGIEGRGTKTTLDADGDRIPQAELKLAYFIGDMLAHVAKADEVTWIDPHDPYLTTYLENQGVKVNNYSALGMVAGRAKGWMEGQGIKQEDVGILIPDRGSIARSLHVAKVTGWPILGLIDKARENGDVYIKKIYGQQNLKGRVVALVDDMIAKGKTLFTDGGAAKGLGAAMTMGLLAHTAGVPEAVNVLSTNLVGDGPAIDKIFISNAAPYVEQLTGIPNLEVVNVMPLFIRCLQAAFSNSPLTDLEEHRLKMLGPSESIARLREYCPGLLDE